MLIETKRSWLTFGALAAGAALTLAACGGDSSSGSGDSSASPLPSISADSELAAGLPEAIKSAGVIKFGTDASYAPMEFIAEDGSTIEGADIDLGNAIAAKLGLTTEWTNSTFDSLIVGVTNGKFDASMSSFTINPERLEQVNMVSYLNAGTAWAVAKGNPENVDPEDACGKSVGVQKATVQVEDIEARNAACTEAGKEPIDIQQFTLQSDATTALASGKVDAMLADSPVIAYAITQTGQLEQVGEIYDSAPYGVVVPLDQEDLAKSVQGAVQAMIDDGTYKEILAKWGLEDGAVTTSELNPTS
ncbi:MAG: ABC transporter substrate-binding protein [Actinobacteria bacterium]|nr:ABC transporter substrate-binding protein [Actinomycetota bacterium]MCB9411482.1 ABC transporter substrate-binding protein [Actinomycetota bacterium]